MGLRDVLIGIRPDFEGVMKPGSSYYLIPCPFHGGGTEKTPSCSVSTTKPVFFCFGCSTGGHLAKLFRQLGVAPGQADRLVSQPGMPSTKDTLLQKISRKVQKNPYRGIPLPEDVLDPYRRAPTSLIRAGFTKDTLRHFEVGYDKMTMRITYPLRNFYGEVVGVSGRAIIEGMSPKYKIYDQELVDQAKMEDWVIPANYTLEAVKKALIWQAHVVSPFLMDSDTIVLTEGFKACMWTYQHGYPNTVALIGARLSQLQSNLVARMARKAVLFLDNNEAGWIGTAKAANALIRRGVQVRVARYPDEREQPDDLSEEEIEEAIDNPMRTIRWKRERNVRI